MKNREQLIAAGVRNLKEFGYPSCNEQNILTDYVYSSFFKSMLTDNLGHGDGQDGVINNLLVELESPIIPMKNKTKKGKR